MKQVSWEEFEEHNAYLGDLKDPYGRRMIMIVSGGVAVFAKCMIEDYYIMKDDFEKIFSDLTFVLAAKLEKGIPIFAQETENMFHSDLLEEISHYLYKSMKKED